MSALAASVSSSSWIPEDDLLLKNAIESGASLEALAKGAVRFSRKYTVRELQDRWRALLYDPVISDRASTRMIEVELSASSLSSKSNKFDNSVENGSTKRKLESVRRLYYSMRKRTCNQLLTKSSDVSFLGSPNDNDCIRNRGGCEECVRPREDYVQSQFGFCELGIDSMHNGSKEDDLKVALKKDFSSEKVEKLEQNDVLEGSPRLVCQSSVEFGHPSEVEGIKPYSMGCSSPQPHLPLWKTMKDVPVTVMPINGETGDKGQDAEGEILHPKDVDGKKVCAFGNDVVPSDMMLKDGYEINSSAAISGGDLAETDALLNFDGDTMDRSCYDSVNSLLLNSPNDVQEDDTSKTKEPEILVSDTCPGISEASYPAKLDEIPDQQQSHSGLGEQLGTCCPEINLPSSTSISNPHASELHDEVICCMVNSEDPEIPCNDDVLLGKAFALSITQKCHKEGSEQASSFANQEDGKEELSLMETEDNLTQSFTAPKMVGLDILSESSQGVKSEFHDGHCHLISRQAQNSLVNPCRFKAAQAFSNSAKDGAAKEEPSDECNTKDMPIYAGTSSVVDTVLEPEANLTTSDKIEYDSDDDVPSFSDIEAMILEMDLCPDESDSLTNREVSWYQDEHAKRTIIRLEQCARSAMQRAIASQGALAVFYGRHMKHYIKETEVILGRATVDVDVDIDLGREGHANKISRRQAIIKMEEDGSFSLKNLGKSSIFLNGKEVCTGQLMGLGSSSLIEIRDMAFVFEINQNSVKRYLANITQKNQEKKRAFDHLEERKRVLDE
ncbi:uncharacterized protein LOC111292661 isoform X2 [Durio zibethinus]|uniref:Uncharacterized protein LOC111292661 isoform X2 n=1 Tax=Durio zibethinus TaxID=66656 RepID=A0A6P5YKS2_DURZI|nr:uncharacterized protein LOC111292661 isoform X2 [Durio zibethinus]